MKRDDRAPEDEAGGADEAMDHRVADAMVRRGELLPTTEAEVRAAERDRVDFEGELPPALRHPPRRSSRPPAHGREVGAPPVVSLDAVRRRRERARSGWTSHVATFTLGAAAAAALLVATRPGDTPRRPDDRPAGAPTASADVAAPAEAPITIPAVTTCSTACCAGARCDAARGELRRCASGRTCVACESNGTSSSAYRVRLGNLVPAKGLAADVLTRLDLCARVGGAPWSCEPAHADALARPAGRVLPGAYSAADLGTAIELELRPRGTKQVLGRWREAVRIGPTVLCQGVGALVANEKEDLGSLAIDLEDTHWVEIARAADVATLHALRARLVFTDVEPSLVETSGAERFALVVGPLDAGVAEALRWALLERGLEARVVLGGDHQGAPRRLPATTPPPHAP